MSVAARRIGPRPDRGDKRDALLRAAIDTFAARGFFNAQVADVARAAGVAAGTVYLYFHGKDDLLVSIFERTMTDAIADGRRGIEVLPDPAARLLGIARRHLERLGRDRALAIVFQVELRQSTKFMERLSATQLREYLGIIRDVIADGQAAGTFRPEVNPTFAAKLFFGMLDEMATNWILSKRKYSLVSEADAIADLFIAGVARVSGSAAPALRAKGRAPDPSTLREPQGHPEPGRGTTGSGSSRAMSRDERKGGVPGAPARRGARARVPFDSREQQVRSGRHERGATQPSRMVGPREQ